MSDIPPLYCAYHPQVETGLRCSHCDKQICAKCAIRTPTGYRCKECVRNQQKVFDNAEWYDPIIAAVLAGVLSFLGSLLVSVMGFFTIFVAPIAGVAIAEVVRIAVRRRRSTRLFQIATAAAVIGSLPLLVLAILRIAGYGFVGGIWGLLWHGFYTFTITSTVFYRLKGIRIG